MVFVNGWGVWALALVSAVVARAIVRRYWTLIRDVPGPLLASFSNLWQVSQILKGHTEAETIRLHQEHGKPVCVIHPIEPRGSEYVSLSACNAKGTLFASRQTRLAFLIPMPFDNCFMPNLQRYRVLLPLYV